MAGLSEHFLFPDPQITWVGPAVGPLKKAKVSTGEFDCCCCRTPERGCHHSTFLMPLWPSRFSLFVLCLTDPTFNCSSRHVHLLLPVLDPTDKAFVKEVVQSYAKEFLADNKNDLKYDTLLAQVKVCSVVAWCRCLAR